MSKKAPSPWAYIREWDLTKYDREVLNNYNLKNMMYIYIGSSDGYNMMARSSKWRNHIKSNNKSVSLEIREFISSLELFYRNELKLSKDEIDKKLYYDNARVVDYYSDLIKAREVESQLTNSYKTEEIFEKYKLLSNRASQLEEIRTDDAVKLKLKKHKKNEEFNSVGMELIYKNNRFYMKLNDTEYEMTELKIVPINQNNDIIKKDKKNISNESKH